MADQDSILVDVQPDATGEIKLQADPDPKVDEKVVDSPLPEKFTGKSAEDIAEMYMNLESEHGRVTNEFGTMRAQNEVLNDLLTNHQAQTPVVPEPAVETYKVDAASLLDDPQGTLEKWYESRVASDRTEYDSRLSGLETQLQSVNVRTRVTDFDEVAASAEFGEWVRKSPTRQRIAQQAGEGDSSAALMLVEEYKAQAVTVPEPTPADPAKEALDRAAGISLESPGSVEPAGDASLPIFKASELRRLKMTDYEAYSDPKFQDEVLLAYHQGRVR